MLVNCSFIYYEWLLTCGQIGEILGLGERDVGTMVYISAYYY